MNNLTQPNYDGKQTSLDKLQKEMLAKYQHANQTERQAIIGHINAFLPIVCQDAKAFWSNFRQKLEGLNNGSQPKTKK